MFLNARWPANDIVGSLACLLMVMTATLACAAANQVLGTPLSHRNHGVQHVKHVDLGRSLSDFFNDNRVVSPADQGVDMCRGGRAVANVAPHRRIWNVDRGECRCASRGRRVATEKSSRHIGQSVLHLAPERLGLSLHLRWPFIGDKILPPIQKHHTGAIEILAHNLRHGKRRSKARLNWIGDLERSGPPVLKDCRLGQPKASKQRISRAEPVID